MRSVYAAALDADQPLRALAIGDLDVAVPAGWVPVRLTAAALNHHDLWSLRGVGLGADALPMVLGTDAAGTDADGRAVIVHSVISSPDWDGDETLDPRRSLLSERHPGTMTEVVHVPARNVLPAPAGWSAAEAACLPTAYLTAYRLLFDAADARPGQRVLVQGAGGGVATAAVLLGRAAGLHMVVTSRSPEKLAAALALGAHEAVPAGERIAPVDAVIETVGEATWNHSLRSLRPGGVIAVAGATSGSAPSADLNRVFFRSLRIVGTTMGTRAQLGAVAAMMDAAGIRPAIAATYDFGSDDAVRSAFAALESGTGVGKHVLTL